MATIRQRGKKVQVQIRLLGTTDSATFPNKTMAKLWAVKREAEIVAGARGLVVTGYTVADAIDRFVKNVCPTRKGGRWEALRLGLIRREWDCVGKAVDRVSSDDVGRLRDHRLQSVKPPSVRRELVLLAAVFETAKTEWRWCANNPVHGVTKPPHGRARKRLVQPFEYKAILRAAKYRPGQIPVTKTQWVAAAWCLALRTGMRAGELMKLEWHHVDLKGRVAELEDTKNGTDRQVPLFPRALRILAAMPRKAQGVDPAGSSRCFYPISSGALDALFRKTRDATGIKGLRFHDSRATAVTMFAKFLPTLDLARVIGHSNLSQLLTYYRDSAATIADRVSNSAASSR